MAGAEQKSFTNPDEVREFPKGRGEIINVGGETIGRYTAEPGWRWTDDIKPAVGTELCEAPHFQYHVSGRLGVRMADGTELEIGPGEVSVLPPGHDAWVIGDEAVVVVDWSGAYRWAKSE